MTETRASLDLEAYASKYRGASKIMRLEWIASKSAELELDALRYAIDEVKKGRNTLKYKELVARVNNRLQEPYNTIDEAWVSDIDTRAAIQLEKLENELNGYKTNQIKESIRMGYTDLGDFYSERGNLEQALRSYVKTRDYCTSGKHVIQVSLNMIRVNIEMKDFLPVENYVRRAEQAPEVLSDQIVVSKLKCCVGLANMVKKKYKAAALEFVGVNFGNMEDNATKLHTEFSEIMAPDDVTIYGGLCALATFSRAELREKVIENPPIRALLELVPEMRELINDFFASRYNSCLNYMEKLRPDLELDVYISHHAENLYHMIRSKALIQYVTPYTTVDLRDMARAFNTTPDICQEELAKLIVTNEIQARIDSHNKYLYKKRGDSRKKVIAKAMIRGQTAFEEIEVMLLRMNMIKLKLVYRDPDCQNREEVWKPRPLGGIGATGGIRGALMKKPDY